jgi:hypothetical protein
MKIAFQGNRKQVLFRANAGMLVLLVGLMFFMTSPSNKVPVASWQLDNFEGYFIGHLGHYPIELYLEKKDQQLSGRYIQRFKSRQRSIELTGFVEEGGQLHLNGKGIFTGKWTNGQIEGFWYRSADSKEKYPFTLKRKDPPYYASDYWMTKKLSEGVQMSIPRESTLHSTDTSDLFNGRMIRSHSIKKDAQILNQAYTIQFPVRDSSIVSHLNLELAVYQGVDSLRQLLPADSPISFSVEELSLDDKTISLLEFEEGTASGSYRSKLYFYKQPGNQRSFLFHLFYSYTNPWIYGNPYSKDDYEGPRITDMNRLVEIVEMIIASV